MRSPRELLFRARQEAANLLLVARPPALSCDPPAAAPPPPSAAPEGLEPLAAGILQHRFPLLGLTIDTGPAIAWRRDYLRGIESPPVYFRRLPYLDAACVGDHKTIWELNRHQHFILLAQAFLATGRRGFLDELTRQWESWDAANPYLRGMNWASALEVAFRALSWLWVDRLAGHALAPAFRRRLHAGLYRHGCCLEHNLSVYFSPNTHLLGEAVALHALGTAFPSWPRAPRWTAAGARLVADAMERQVRPDGSHFEQSSYYHLYALDFFLLHAILAGGAPPPYLDKLARMAEYLDALAGPQSALPLLGDDDGGRLFHPYGPREEFCRATLATCAVFLDRPDWLRDPASLAVQAAWWLPGRAAPAPAPRRAPAARLFPDAGTAVLESGDIHIVVDAGPMGAAGAGHSHSDALSLVVRAGAEEVLVDAGTFTYVGDPAWRDWFRGPAAHNTIRIDAAAQADPAGPFRWHAPPRVELLAWRPGVDFDFLDGACHYRGLRHRRRILFLRPARLFILDEVEGPGDHAVEQFWHPGAPTHPAGPRSFAIGRRARLALCGPGCPELAEGGAHGWRSRVFARKEPAPVIRLAAAGPLPLRLGAVLDLSASAAPLAPRLEESGGAIRITLAGQPGGAVFSPAAAHPL